MVNGKMDFVTGITHLFDSDGMIGSIFKQYKSIQYFVMPAGGRITSIDQLEDGGEYVCAASRKFIPANYGMLTSFIP